MPQCLDEDGAGRVLGLGPVAEAVGAVVEDPVAVAQVERLEGAGARWAARRLGVANLGGGQRSPGRQRWLPVRFAWSSRLSCFSIA